MLYSGGADSLAIWYMMGKPKGIYVKINAPYQDKEIAAIERQMQALPDLSVEYIDGPDIGSQEHSDGFIPLRNTVLIVTAVAHTNANILYVGFLRGEASTDKDAKFLDLVSEVITHSEGRAVNVVAPAIHMTKPELLLWLKREYPDAPLHETVSCYAANGEPCGDCPSCFRADAAKYLSGWSDKRPTLPSRRGSAIAALRKAGIRRWPDMLVNNWQTFKAMRGWR